MIERQYPFDPAVVVRADGTIWANGQQLIGYLSAHGYLVVCIAGRQVPYAKVIRDAFSPVRHLQRDVPEAEREEIARAAQNDTITNVARKHGIAYHVAWRIVNGRV